MNIIILLIFISLILVALALVLYVFSVRNHDLDHTDQLSLMPLEEEGHQSGGKKEQRSTP